MNNLIMKIMKFLREIVKCLPESLVSRQLRFQITLPRMIVRQILADYRLYLLKIS